MSYDDDEIDLPQRDVSPLEFLRAVYMNEQVALPVRIKCAVEALPFVHPKLSISAYVEGEGFADRLERAIKRSGISLTIEQRVIDAKPAPPKSDVTGPMLATSNRLRRL
jgi:hypothetical protein